jgi:hypothetical protein
MGWRLARDCGSSIRFARSAANFRRSAHGPSQRRALDELAQMPVRFREGDVAHSRLLTNEAITYSVGRSPRRSRASKP